MISLDRVLVLRLSFNRVAHVLPFLQRQYSLLHLPRQNMQIHLKRVPVQLLKQQHSKLLKHRKQLPRQHPNKLLEHQPNQVSPILVKETLKRNPVLLQKQEQAREPPVNPMVYLNLLFLEMRLQQLLLELEPVLRRVQLRKLRLMRWQDGLIGLWVCLDWGLLR